MFEIICQKYDINVYGPIGHLWVYSNLQKAVYIKQTIALLWLPSQLWIQSYYQWENTMIKT
jgi:hypothetical protein